MLLEMISSRIIDQFISSASASSKNSASPYHRTLKAAFNKAVVWNYIEVNPFDKIKAPRVPKSLPLFISECELIEILNNTNSQLIKDIFIPLRRSSLFFLSATQPSVIRENNLSKGNFSRISSKPITFVSALTL